MRPALERYLDREFPGCSPEAMTGDASKRRFWRISLPDGETRVVMDYGAGFDGETDDVVLSRVFREAGLPVAGIEDVSPEAGCLVLEDLGDCTLERALASADGDRRRNLLRTAVELAIAVATRGSAVLARSARADGPVLDAGRFRFEMDFFIENYAGRLLGRTVGPPLVSALHDLADAAAATPRRVLCHRDFHSRNLMVRKDGTLAMVDIQDARWGPDLYDLASLLRDAYVDVDPGDVEWALDLAGVGADRTIAGRFQVVGAQRMIKALGTFGFQVAGLGNRRYADAISRTIRRLRRELARDERTAGLLRRLDEAGLLNDP